MKFIIIAAITMMTCSIQASDSTSEMSIEEILLESGEKAVVMSCTCYRGPGQGQPYTCEPVQKTCYGGPGNYPYTCYTCPQ